MPVSKEGQRKNTPNVCMRCRKRKVKCDGRFPKCSNCIKQSDTCEYDDRDRRSLYSKRTIELLLTRIQLLESILMHHGIHYPPPTDEFGPSGAPWRELQLQAAPRRGLSVYPDEARPSISSPVNDIQALTAAPTTASQYEANKSANFAELNTNTLDLQHQKASDDMISELANRLGSFHFAEDGHSRFFGATSNLHIVGDDPLPEYRPFRHSAGSHPASLFNSEDPINPIVSDEMEEHLLNLFFAWEGPLTHVVKQEAFMERRRRHKSEPGGNAVYSQAIASAMCIFGAAFSGGLSGLSNSLVECFALRAKTQLDAELDNPGVSTVQSLVIMSAAEAMLTMDSRGWLYCGMAISLAFDLGLHLDVSSHVESGAMSEDEVDERYCVFWGSYITLRLWNAYMGRNYAVNDSDITAPRPFERSKSRHQDIWINFGDCWEPAHIRLANPTELVDEAMITLCEKMGEITGTIYAQRKIPFIDQESFITHMQAQLQNWKRGLPSELIVDETDISNIYLPHVLQIHMQYHELVILNNRSLLVDLSSGTNEAQKHRQQESRSLCEDAAGSITNLVQIYRRHYQMRRANLQVVHIVFTAALILVYASCSSTGEAADKALSQLQVCTQALGELSQSFQSASRALEVVLVFKSRWHARVRAQAQRKRQRPPAMSKVRGQIGAEHQAEKRRMVVAGRPDERLQNITHTLQDSHVEPIELPWLMLERGLTEDAIRGDDLLQDVSLGFLSFEAGS